MPTVDPVAALAGIANLIEVMDTHKGCGPTAPDCHCGGFWYLGEQELGAAVAPATAKTAITAGVPMRCMLVASNGSLTNHMNRLKYIF